MDVGKFAKKIEFAAMELRGYQARLEALKSEIEGFLDKAQEAEQRASNRQDADLRRASLWSESVELLTEATSEFPNLLQSLDDIVSGVENAPTPLNEICTIVAAEAIDKHDRKLGKNSAFNR